MRESLFLRPFIIWNLLFCLVFESGAGATSTTLSPLDPMNEQINQNIAEVIQASTSPCRKFLRRNMIWKIRSRALKRLSSLKGDYSEAQKQALALQAVRDVVRAVDHMPRQAIGLAALLSLMAVNAKITSLLLNHFVNSKSFVPVFITYLSFLGVTMLGGRILDPLSAWTRRFGFWLIPPVPQETVAAIPISPILQEAWHHIQIYSMTEQTATYRLQNHVKALEDRMRFALQIYFLAKNEPTLQRRIIVDQLAAAAYWARLFSLDVPLDSPFSLIAVQVNFMNYYPDTEGLADDVYKRVLELDIESHHSAYQGYYRQLVDTWYR